MMMMMPTTTTTLFDPLIFFMFQTQTHPTYIHTLKTLIYYYTHNNKKKIVKLYISVHFSLDEIILS